MVKRKFMQQIDDLTFKQLRGLAKKRHIMLQELMRAVIIPEWMEKQKAQKREALKKRNIRVHV